MKEMELFKKNADLGLLLIRIAIGVGFLAHGVQKLQGMEGIIKFFGSLGLPPVMAWVVGISETAVGLALILGVQTQLAGLVMAAIMIGVYVLVKKGKGYLGGGFELESLYLLGGLGIALVGAGKHTLWSVLGKKPDAPKQS
jgi:putative oxidoreductase